MSVGAGTWTVGQLGLCGDTTKGPGIDTAAIRATWDGDEVDLEALILALCDALDEARADRDRREPVPDTVTGMPSYMQQVARAETAEAERDRLAAEVQAWHERYAEANTGREQLRQKAADLAAEVQRLNAHGQRITDEAHEAIAAWERAAKAERVKVDEARAALARVEALCEHDDAYGRRGDFVQAIRAAIAGPELAPAAKVPDLVEALRQSIVQAKERRAAKSAPAEPDAGSFADHADLLPENVPPEDSRWCPTCRPGEIVGSGVYCERHTP